MKALKNVSYLSCGLLQDQSNTNIATFISHSHLTWPVFIDLIAAVSIVKDHGVARHFRRRPQYRHFLKFHPEKHGSIKIINNEKYTAMFRDSINGNELFPPLNTQVQIGSALFHVFFGGFDFDD